ncbi:MAG: FAD-dependent oxidoreductase [Lachnospiraceae bacterium]|nr:FAD-dependent oxidoreductase [Lachnospiraceae bacterium]
MAFEEYTNKIIDTDLLVVGGGTAGCPMAAKAAEAGLKVTIVEKSETQRSGNIGHGIDSYGIIPHGITVQELLPMYYDRMTSRNQGNGRTQDWNIDYVLFNREWWAIEELERMGIPMKWDNGEYYWVPHMIHGDGGDLKLGLRVHWHDVKPKMNKMCLERGVQILNRVMVVDILTHNGRACGATAINTRTGEFMIIKAKAVALATGMFDRLFDPETPLIYKYKMRYHYNPASCSGDGYAVAFRSGAGLAHMDDASWALRIRDDITNSYGNFVNNDGILAKQYYWNGEPAIPYHANTYVGNREAEDLGLLPIYQSLEHMPDDFQKRLEMNFLDERFVSLKLAADRGFNPRTHRYELMYYKPLQMMMIHGVFVDETMMSPYLKGLYAAGDCAAGVGGAWGACTSGLLIGDTVADYISQAGEAVIDEEQVAKAYEKCMAPTKVKDGTMPMELEVSIRHICERYVGAIKSEGKLREGIRRFEDIKETFLPQLMAPNPHYQMRALEVMNIMDLTELHLYGCFNRKETRGQYVRIDYPEVDHTRDNYITINRMVDGKSIVERAFAPGLKPEYEEALKKA